MPIANLKKSSDILKPNIEIICDDNLISINKKKIVKRIMFVIYVVTGPIKGTT